jgi:hypothetical protein
MKKIFKRLDSVLSESNSYNCAASWPLSARRRRQHRRCYTASSFSPFIPSLLARIMSIKPKSVSRWLSISALSVFLCACNSSYLSVKKSELTALDQCQQAQQSQQNLLAQQQARLDESLALLQQGLELQKRQAEAPPPAPVEPVIAAVKCPAPPRVVPAATNAEALFLNKLVVGEREQVLLTALDVVLPARINTGISVSQLDARDIQMFERNGEDWVRFKVIDPATQTAHELERRRIRSSTSTKAEDSARRPVVEVRIAIGKVTQNAALTLVDRSGQPFPLLIGRNVLRDVMLVDVSRSNLAPVVREPKENASSSASAKSDESSRP